MNKFFTVLIAVCLVAPVYADDKGQATLHGKTYGEWSAKWWKWIRSIPSGEYPLLASGEFDCTIGQSGPVFFLAGTSGSAASERTCKYPIPNGKELFFSPMNLMWNNVPPENYSEAAKRQLLDGLLSDAPEHPDYNFNWQACKLSVIVDGKSIIHNATALVRTQSPAFRIKVGNDDISGHPAGTEDSAAVADGFWVALRLPKGQHTLKVGGDLCDQDGNPVDGFHQDYTYHLRVE